MTGTLASFAPVRFGFENEAKNETPPLVHQVHGIAIVGCLSNAHADTLRAKAPDADGVMTFQTKLPLYVFSADCLPVLLASEEREGPIAAVHSGWRGAKLGVVAEAVRMMDVEGRKLHAILGPSLRSCCFEVRADFISEFTASRGDISPYLSQRGEKQFFDLSRFVIEQELRGLPPENIHTEFLQCTYCSKPELPSYRRNKITDPRIRAWIIKL